MRRLRSGWGLAITLVLLLVSLAAADASTVILAVEGMT
jgi:hypothetical protein